MGPVVMSVVLPSDEELESLEGRELDEALWSWSGCSAGWSTRPGRGRSL